MQRGVPRPRRQGKRRRNPERHDGIPGCCSRMGGMSGFPPAKSQHNPAPQTVDGRDVRRSRLVFGLWLAVAVGAILTRREILYNLWYLLTALLVVSFLWSWTGVRWVRIARQTR